MNISINKNKVIMALAENNMTAHDLERKAKLGKNTIYTIFKHGTCTTKTMYKIAKALNAAVSELTDMEGLA